MIFQKGDSVALAVQNPLTIPPSCRSVLKLQLILQQVGPVWQSVKHFCLSEMKTNCGFKQIAPTFSICLFEMAN